MSEEDRKKLDEARFIVWEDFGSEGWRPRGFGLEYEVWDAIRGGEFHGHIIVTGCARRMRVRDE